MHNYPNRLSAMIESCTILLKNLNNKIYDNYILHNKLGTGILIHIPSIITGANIAQGDNICLNELPADEFKGNVITNCFFGIWIDLYYNPKKLQCSDNVEKNKKIMLTEKVVFSNIKIYHCYHGMIFDEIGNFELTDSFFHGNIIGIIVNKLVEFELNSISYPNYQYCIKNTTISCASSDDIDITSQTITAILGITLPKSNGLLLDNVVFKNFKKNKFSFPVYCMQNNPIYDSVNGSDSEGGICIF